ncbi:hypothetical protein QFC22_001399 [Naganishia vaughanmartiniae]|uniref:Uncharacterized protein n=1 Tax=Naganishia vaughanmartiniae TaxID=1424756 RepID=A0ACC2XJI1_9TREE|nr:hypothetical protein QFC22_001399 [Naganishia vaughanmartiniae]
MSVTLEKGRASVARQGRGLRSSSGLSATTAGESGGTSASDSRSAQSRSSAGAGEEKHHSSMLGRFTGKGKGRPSTAPGHMPGFSYHAPVSQSPQISASPERCREPIGKRYELDTDLNDMRGIVDMSQLQAATAPHSPSGGFPPHADDLTSRSRLSSAQTVSSGSTGYPGRTSNATSNTSDGSGRVLISPTEKLDSPFQPQNPFFPSLDTKIAAPQHVLPPSPHTTIQKQSVSAAPSQPRRPSQLRQVESTAADVSPGSSIFTPPQSSSVRSSTYSMETGQITEPTQRKRPTMRIDLQPNTFSMDAAGFNALTALTPDVMSPGTHMQTFRLTPLSERGGAGGAQAAWQAPESWGVEGDEEPEDTASSDEADNIPDTSADYSVNDVMAEKQPDLKKPPPFGYNSGLKRKQQRPTTGNLSLRSRPATGGKLQPPSRPGTSGSNHANVTHYIRIYNPEGTYTTMAWPLYTTTSEILHALAAKALGAKGTMKLYIRERGQERLLLPSEKPLAIQLRRILQAGYTDADKITGMGRENLAMLCRFVYQPPVLPKIDPEDESSYDSFELVDLAGRDLQTIPIFLHRHAHSIISLNLSRNSMSDVPLDFVQAAVTLRELRMTYMALKRVPTSIRHSPALTRLDISCNRIQDLEHAGLNDIPTLVSLKAVNNRLTTLPLYFAEMKSLKYLNISNNKFTTLPDHICQMRGLLDLDVSFNEISTLPSALCELGSLERLVAAGNALVTFPDSFSSLASLRELDVRRNQLTDLKAVYALPNLAILQAEYNNLVSLDAQLGPKVREFGVPFNSLTRFTLAARGALDISYSLTVLDLSYAKLSTLDEDALRPLVNLDTLKLDYNKFSRLPETLELLPNLRTLSCVDNVLFSLPSGLWKLPKLEILNVHNNNLKEIPTGIWHCKSLRVLNASSNLLAGFPDRPVSMQDALVMFDQAEDASISPGFETHPTGLLPLCSSLRKLLLCDNQLSDDIFDTIAVMGELRCLNLSFNDIYEIPTWSLSKNPNLEELYLSGNNLTSLPSEDLERLTSLRVIHLNGNKLRTLPAELGKIQNLMTLDVGSNVLKYNIANWPYDWNWNWNLELRYLNLSGNKRLEIKPSYQHEPHLGASSKRDLADFSKLTNLRMLGLMDVTVRIPSLPDEYEDRRVRTSVSEVNTMGYGISDTLGKLDHLAMIDLVVPNFRSHEDECLFGMFGLAVPLTIAGKVPKYVEDRITGTLQRKLEAMDETDTVRDALRRTFLTVNRDCFDQLMLEDQRRKNSSTSSSAHIQNPTAYNAFNQSFRGGASAAVMYMKGKTVYIANTGRVLAVVSCGGEAELLSETHDPFEREETLRIRASEGWVSHRGLVNDDVPISRGFGFYHAVPAVNSLPYVSTRQLTDVDEFIIIANRALWDHCSYQTAVDIARGVKDDPMKAAQKLRDLAISYGSEGSIMVMVISVNDLFRQRTSRSNPYTERADDGGNGDGGRIYSGTKRNRRKAEDIGDRTLLRLEKEVQPPTGQVALVFTDIKNSTSLWEINPGMQTAMRMHNSLLRRQLRIIGGYEVKTEGDAFMVSFPTVTSALLWTFTCQLQLMNEDWPREILECEDGREIRDSNGELISRGLSVRMGIHVGVPVWEKDPVTRRMDYFGPMVNKSSRVSASAEGGFIFISADAMKEVEGLTKYLENEEEANEAADTLGGDTGRDVVQLRKLGVGVLEMGERKLKGLEVPEKLFMVYPKALAGRLELSTQLPKDVEVKQPKLYGGEDRIINVDELRHLVALVFRLEALSASKLSAERHKAIAQPSPSTPKTSNIMLEPAIGVGIDATPSMQNSVSDTMISDTLDPLDADTQGKPDDSTTFNTPSRAISPSNLFHPASYLGPRVSDEMTDDELTAVLESLLIRMENALSTLILKQIGDVYPVLASLSEITKIQPSSLLSVLSAFAAAYQPPSA